MICVSVLLWHISLPQELQLCMTRFYGRVTSGFVIYALTFLESVILGIDVISVTYYIVVTSWKEIRELAHE